MLQGVLGQVSKYSSVTRYCDVELSSMQYSHIHRGLMCLSFPQYCCTHREVLVPVDDIKSADEDAGHLAGAVAAAGTRLKVHNPASSKSSVGKRNMENTRQAGENNLEQCSRQPTAA